LSEGGVTMLEQAWREVSRRRPSFQTEPELEACPFRLYPAWKPSSRWSETVRESAEIAG